MTTQKKKVVSVKMRMQKSKGKIILLLILISFIIPVYTQTAYAGQDGNVVITITTNEDKAGDIFNQLYKDDYAVYKDGNKITATYNGIKAEQGSTQNADKTQLTSSRSYPNKQYLIYGLGAAVIIMILIIATKISGRKKQNEEYYGETNDSSPVYYQFNNNPQCINLTQRLEEMQSKPFNYPYGSAYGTAESHYNQYSRYSEQDQFNLIRQKPRDY